MSTNSRSGLWSVLKHRDLRLLFGGLLFSSMGSWAYNVALLAVMYQRTHSVGWVAAASLIRYLAGLLVTSYAGLLAERLERIRLMIRSDLLCCLWQAGLALTVALGGPLVLALALSVLSTVTGSVYGPATAATIPTLVGENELVAANSLNSTLDNFVVIAGPAVGAVILLIGSPAAVFAVNAISFAGCALAVSRIKTRTKPVDVTEDGTASLRAQLAVGFQTIWSDRAARTLVAMCGLVTVLWGSDTVLLVAVSAHRLGDGSRGWGYLLASLGAGGILAAPLVNRLARSGRLAPIITVGALGYCLPTALLTLTHSVPIACVIEIFRGSSTLMVDVLAVTVMQRAVPSDRLGRVFGVFFTIVYGASALGALLGAPAVSVFGLNHALLIFAFAPAILVLIAVPALLSIDRDTAAAAAMLAPRVAVLEQLQIFSGASRTLLERLAGAAVMTNFAAGTAIITEGETADALYALAEGTVDVTSRGEAGGPSIALRTMQAPDLFGEIGVLEGIPRTATVTAATDCVCERIDKDTFLDALTSTPISTSLVDTARGRLALTHPSRMLATTAEPATAEPATAET
jgi:MFS family permease